MAFNRICKEYREMTQNPPENTTAHTVSENDMFNWKATIVGPDGTPYSGGIFIISVHFPADYPFKPPRVQFMTKIFHPNINANGGICLRILEDHWSPALTISRVLSSICQLLSNPIVDNPLMPEIAVMYVEDRNRFCNMAASWTHRYAT